MAAAVIVLFSEQRFRLQHVQMVNKTSSFKLKLTGNNAEASKVNRYALMFNFPTF